MTNMKDMLGKFMCWLGSHEAAGPDAEGFEIRPGEMHPYYHCRRCMCILKWKVDGGWESVPPGEPVQKVESGWCAVWFDTDREHYFVTNDGTGHSLCGRCHITGLYTLTEMPTRMAPCPDCLSGKGDMSDASYVS